MPLDTPPAESTPRSANIHSRRVLDRIEAHSPGSKPSAARPRAISRAISPSSRQLVACQMPKSFWRRATRSPRRRTAFQNSSGMVSPGTGSGCCRRGARVHRLVTLPPHLLFLPSPLAAHARLLDPQVKLADVFLLPQPRALVLHDDAAHLQHIAVIAQVQ